LQLSRGAGLNPDHPINESHAGLGGGGGNVSIGSREWVSELTSQLV